MIKPIDSDLFVLSYANDHLLQQLAVTKFFVIYVPKSKWCDVFLKTVPSWVETFVNACCSFIHSSIDIIAFNNLSIYSAYDIKHDMDSPFKTQRTHFLIKAPDANFSSVQRQVSYVIANALAFELDENFVTQNLDRNPENGIGNGILILHSYHVCKTKYHSKILLFLMFALVSRVCVILCFCFICFSHIFPQNWDHPNVSLPSLSINFHNHE